MAREGCMALPTGPWHQVLTAVLGSFIALIAITANILILIAVHKTRALQSVTNYLLACLALSDFFVGAVALPLWIIRSLLEVSEEEHPLSVGVDCVYTLSVAISSYNLCAISLERYVGVVYPLRYNTIVTVQRFKCVAVSVWVISVCIASLRLLVNEDAFWITSVTLAFFLPGIVISYCYLRIFKEAARQSRSIAERDAPTSVTHIHNKKASITVAIVIGLFYISALPALVFSIHEVVSADGASCHEIKSVESWGVWALFLALSNAALNPWIYAVRKREFRAALRSILYWTPVAVDSDE